MQAALEKDWSERFGGKIDGIQFKRRGPVICVMYLDALIATATWREYKNKNGLEIIDIETANNYDKDLILVIRAFLLQSLSTSVGTCCLVIDNRVY